MGWLIAVEGVGREDEAAAPVDLRLGGFLALIGVMSAAAAAAAAPARRDECRADMPLACVHRVAVIHGGKRFALS